LKPTEFQARVEAAKTYVAEQSLFSFVRQSWPVLEPETTYLKNWHIKLICDSLSMVTSGKWKRLVINIPPRYMKSLLVSVNWPVWTWISKPETRFMFTSYSAGLSDTHSRKRSAILESDWYRSRWGDKFVLTTNKVGEIINNHQGHMISVGLGGSATGKGGNILVVDDPIDPEAAWSDAQRENVNRTYDDKFRSRLDDKVNGAIVFIMQRLHEGDLTGHATGIGADELNDWIIHKGRWTLIRLSAVAEQDETITSPLTGEVLAVRKEGELLWPEREPWDSIQEMMEREYIFAGQYQQRPTTKGGSIFKREWFKFYDDPPAHYDMIVTSWDLAFTGTERSDWVVGQIWGKVNADYFLLDQIKGRWDFTKTLQMFTDQAQSDLGRRGTKLVEDAANAQALLSTLKEYIDGIKLIPPSSSKEARAHAVSDLFETGHVYLPSERKCPWIKEWISEMTTFPNAAHDDQVDTTTQALNYLRSHGGKPLATANRLVKRNLFVRGV